MKYKHHDKDFDFSKVDLTKVPLNELDYYARNSSLKQVVGAICKLMKKMGLIKDEDEKREVKQGLSTVSKSYINKAKDIQDFRVGNFVDQQEMNVADKVILNHKLQELESDRQLANTNSIEKMSDELVLDDDYTKEN